ncbi:MAG: hypothetical protein AAGA87_01045 [Pseudomonadota bacterium]
MSNPYLLPDLVVALSTVAGLVIVYRHIGPSQDGLSRRFRWLLFIAATFYGLRAVGWLADIWLFRAATVVMAVAVPVAALTLAEGLLRRHAPLWVKTVIAAGALITALVGIMPTMWTSTLLVRLLLAYQVIAFALIAWLVLTRDRSTLSPIENATINRISLALVAIFPMILTDFRGEPFGIPVRMSGLAALIVCWIALNLEDRAQTARSLAVSLALILAIPLIAALAIGAHLQAGTLVTTQIAAMIAAPVFALLIALAALTARRTRARRSVIGTLRRTKSLDDYLATLQGLSDGFTIVSEDDLKDFDQLRTAFDATGAARHRDLPKSPGDDTLEQSQLREFLRRHAGSEAFVVSDSPLRIAVGTPQGISATADRDLQAAFGLARLIAERDALKRGTP